MSIQDVIVDIVALSGGRIVGRTRMQKTVYLLDALGLGSEASYYYYNYGPFSDDIADGISDCKFVGSIAERIGYRQVDGSPFSVFETTKDARCVMHLGRIARDQASVLLSRLGSASATVLELAATIHWLAVIEKVADWRSELRRRKGAKADHGRMEQASRLLLELGIKI